MTMIKLTNFIVAYIFGSSAVVIGGVSPIHSILTLIVVFFLGTILLFNLHVEYFALLFLIVYVGAIVVLFLFIVMMLEIKTLNISERLNDVFSFRNIVIAVFLLEIINATNQDFSELYITQLIQETSGLSFFTETNLNIDYSKLLQKTDHIRAIGSTLFTEYKSGIMLVALILFLSMVGAIVMTLDASKIGKTLKSQDANHQTLHQHVSTLNVFRLIVGGTQTATIENDFEVFNFINEFLMVSINLISFVLLIVCLLIAVAYFTLYERQVLAALQERQGPNIVGFFGLLQPLGDGLKLLAKESILPKSANKFIFTFAPIFTFGLALSGWVIVPVEDGAVIADFRLGLLYVFALSSLGVHTVIMAGWSSNSKYAFLGGLRSAAQMISYEVSLGVVLVSLLIIAGTLNFSDLVQSQKEVWYVGPLFPIFILFFISALAETNRHPFDLPEAEAELVSGYNVEYSAMGFALFFLAEYSNIILMSALTVLLFLGGWYALFVIFDIISGEVIFALKTMIFITLYILVRGAYPRYRYDQLMRLGWKVFLPISLAFVVLFASIVLSFNFYVDILR